MKERSDILVVDDDPNIRQLVNLYLLKEGFEVVMAERGDDALKLFSEIEPNLQTIREDLGLPEHVPVIPFSAEKGNGRDELVRLILKAAGD